MSKIPSKTSTGCTKSGFGDVRLVRVQRQYGLQTTSKMHPKIEHKIQQKTIAKSSEHRGSGPSKMELREGLGGSGKPWGSLWGSPGEPLGRPRGGLGVPLGSRLDEPKENLGRTPWRTPDTPPAFECS